MTPERLIKHIATEKLPNVQDEDLRQVTAALRQIAFRSAQTSLSSAATLLVSCPSWA